ncbi:hypothetical protein TSTA_110800 [Talaromyces stipitatus ATCC 10500]|uniref:Ankyrin repeat-containing protein n=1 Tax=Talaromyces stipitatus (strain ATCC 10500 / CBS 375.48 / QM 6759 / NRRL 1006) TaxID=441959 RepID=B8MV11_TALSN|nr:uncharacterized protein TSTA_110800 [Talaromyces stipitatus ATCC 10500]EED11901.1 hypothetical protein TSTA_110800 [Talaromyces stipitatus ATCC 10500]
MSPQSQDHIGLKQVIKVAEELYANDAQIVAPSLHLPKLITDVAQRCNEKEIPEVVQDSYTLPGLWRDKKGYTLGTKLMSEGVIEWTEDLRSYMFQIDYNDLSLLGSGPGNLAQYTHNWSEHGNNALHFAARSGDINFAKVLGPSDDDPPNFQGKTALYLAIEYFDEDKKQFIDELLKDKNKSFGHAARVVQSATFISREGKSALELARNKGLSGLIETIQGCVKFLDEPEDGYWPTTKMLKFILNRGSLTKVTFREEDTFKEVKHAIETSNLELFQSCIDQYWATILGWKDPKHENTILHSLLQFQFNASRHFMAMIILDIAQREEKYKDFINRTNKYGETAEHIVIKMSLQVPYLELLHSRGSNIYATDNRDQYYMKNPREIAGSRKEPKHGELIKTKGKDKKSALELILSIKAPRQVKILVQIWPQLVTMLSEEDRKTVNEIWQLKLKHCEDEEVKPDKYWLEIVRRVGLRLIGPTGVLNRQQCQQRDSNCGRSKPESNSEAKKEVIQEVIATNRWGRQIRHPERYGYT